MTTDLQYWVRWRQKTNRSLNERTKRQGREKGKRHNRDYLFEITPISANIIMYERFDGIGELDYVLRALVSTNL